MVIIYDGSMFKSLRDIRMSTDYNDHKIFELITPDKVSPPDNLGIYYTSYQGGLYLLHPVLTVSIFRFCCEEFSFISMLQRRQTKIIKNFSTCAYDYDEA